MRNLEETFGYDSQNRLTGVWLNLTQTGSSAYDSYGRMTTKTANGQAVFSNVSFSSEKPHALTSATTAEGVFPSAAQTVTYTGFDKVSMVKQGKDSLCYAYGYDRQRILMEEHFDNTLRTKRYVGNCEFVTETDGNTTVEYSHTFLTGPYGVFAVAKRKNGNTELYYVLKDNLGSWTVVTGETGIVKQELGYDAWGNLRNPQTWANYTQNDVFDKPMFDRGYTGHEHLATFGLINMNGRVYDPVMSSFLSADRYVQDPSSAQGFNRYAYCLYNPLRYVDPTGWRSGSGGGHSPDDPPHYVYMDGYSGYLLDDVTVIDSRIFHFDIDYTSHNNAGGGNDNQWNEANDGQPTGYKSGSGGGRGGYGNTSLSSDDQGFLSNLYPVISCEGVVIGYKQQQWQHPKNRAQKAINQKKAYEIQKSLKSKGVSKHVKDIKAGKSANLSLASKGIAALEIGFEVYDVINNKEIMPSNVLNTTITIVSVWCWPIGGIYLVTDIGVLLFTGQSIGEHIDEWVGEPLIDFKP